MTRIVLKIKYFQLIMDISKQLISFILGTRSSFKMFVSSLIFVLVLWTGNEMFLWHIVNIVMWAVDLIKWNVYMHS